MCWGSTVEGQGKVFGPLALGLRTRALEPAVGDERHQSPDAVLGGCPLDPGSAAGGVSDSGREQAEEEDG